MTNNNGSITYLRDYKVPEFLIDSVNLAVDLFADKAIVTATINGRRNPACTIMPKDLNLVGSQLTLLAAKLNGLALTADSYVASPSSLTIYNIYDKFILELTTEIHPELNTALVGLYKSKNMFCTQCEAEGFRAITYYLDRPDVMAKFTTTIIADKQDYPVLLSNGNLIATGEVANGRHMATWEDPFPKPCYLFALVACALVAVEDHFLTASGRLVTLKLYVELEHVVQSTYALQALKKAMLWDEINYGRQYDLDIYMIVAVSDFNMGAMENKGLNIFNTKYILASPGTATDVDFIRIDAVVAHEYFHNWSGNRVTCRDWFQLSLKEGFTVFREHQFINDITGSATARIEQFNLLLNKQFVEDMGPLAHPVRPESYMAIDNFYTVTVYEKGAEVVRMLYVLLGKAKFRQATDLYFSNNDGLAATVEDFLAAMTKVSGLDLTLFKLWYTQAGTPTVAVNAEYNHDKQQYKLILQQSVPATPQQREKYAMQIPIAVGLLDPDSGNNLPLQLAGEDVITPDTKVLSFTEQKQEFVFVNIAKPPVLSVLRDFSAPVIVEHSLSDKELAFLAIHDSDPFNRWDALRRLKKNIIMRLLLAEKANSKLTIDSLLLDTYKTILQDQTLDAGLKAELLTLPTSGEMIKYAKHPDPEQIYTVKQFITNAIASSLQNQFADVYANCTDNKPYVHNALEVGKRALKNLSLRYLLILNTPDVLELALQQYRNADNMTDSIGALNACNNVAGPVREKLLANFYIRWQHEALIMDKWLLLQATSELADTAAKVTQLLQHQVFNISNPNKVYALIGGFAGNNPIRFHASNGQGYAILADAVLKLDKLNPQVAARMVAPFSEWQSLDSNRQTMIKQHLTTIANSANISKNLAEIVYKSLAG